MANMQGAMSKIPTEATTTFRARQARSFVRRRGGQLALRALNRIVAGVRAGAKAPADAIARFWMPRYRRIDVDALTPEVPLRGGEVPCVDPNLMQGPFTHVPNHHSQDDLVVAHAIMDC